MDGINIDAKTFGGSGLDINFLLSAAFYFLGKVRQVFTMLMEKGKVVI